MKNSFRAISTLTIIIFAIFSQRGHAFQVVSWDNSSTFGGSGTLDEMWISIGYAQLHSTLYPLFDSIALKPDNVGQTFSIASAVDDPDFDAFTALLTDGNSQNLIVWGRDSGGGGGHILPESTWFSGVSQDAFGYRIDQYDLTINELSITTLNNYTDFYVNYTLQVYGTPIPEPATGSLLILGALTLTGRTVMWRIFKRVSQINHN